MTPNDPRKFHIEDPQPASFQSERLSSIQRSGMRGFVEATPFADVYLNAFRYQRFVRVDVFPFQPGPVPYRFFIVLEWPGRNIEALEFIFGNPVGGVVTHCLWQVTARTLDQTKIRDSHNRCLANVDAVGKD